MLTNLIATNWEGKADGILSSRESTTNKVPQIFAMFAQLPGPGQAVVAQRMPADFVIVARFLLKPGRK
jgi:hypothetical protein